MNALVKKFCKGLDAKEKSKVTLAWETCQKKAGEGNAVYVYGRTAVAFLEKMKAGSAKAPSAS